MKAIGTLLVDSFCFILRPFSPAAWKKDIGTVRSLTPKSFTKNMFDLLPALGIYYLLLSPLVAMPLYNNLLFHPMSGGNFDLKSVDNIPCENLFIPAKNGNRLHAWLFKLPGATKTVLVSHGNGGNITIRDPLVHLILGAGASVLVYDYQGYGKSDGRPSIDGICEDATAAYQYLIDKCGVKPESLVLFGESIGTGATCHLVARHPCAGIILQSAYTSLPAIARQKMPLLQLYPDWMFPPNKLDNQAVLEQPHPPLLLVHGGKDFLIPIAHSEQLYQKAAGPKMFTRLEDAGHNDIYHVDSYQYQQALTDFISSLR